MHQNNISSQQNNQNNHPSNEIQNSISLKAVNQDRSKKELTKQNEQKQQICKQYFLSRSLQQILIKDKQKQMSSSDQQQQKDRKNVIQQANTRFTLQTSLIKLKQYTDYFGQSQQFDQILQQCTSKNANLKKKYQKTIFQSKIFTKSQQYTTKLKISDIKPSKHYQTIQIELQLSFYKLKISILNCVQQSSLHNSSDCCKIGGFGNVYLRHFNEQNYAIKCVPIKSVNTQITCDASIQEKINSLRNVLKQYFFLKFFEILEVGPKTKQIYGFDIVMFDSCIQFSMEVCKHTDNIQLETSKLKQSLKIIHLFNIVHRDIKPGNIMYSLISKKYIFIDFGGSQVLNQSIGYKSLTKFFGTAGYLSHEALQLINKKQNFVDLYYNDLYALQKSIDKRQILQPRQDMSFKSQKQSYSYQTECLKQSFLQQSRLLQMIYDLYSRQYNQFYQKWKRWQRYIQNKHHIEQLISFFIELQPNNQYCQIFVQIFDQSFKEKPEFKELQLSYKNSRYQGLLHRRQFQFKQHKYQKYRNLYQVISIFSKGLEKVNQTALMITLNKDKIQKILFNQTQIQQSQEVNYLRSLSNQKYRVLYCYILLNYCTFSKNLYNADINKKIHAVNIFFDRSIFQGLLHEKQIQLIFACKDQKVVLLAKFFQYFAFKIWSKLPLNLKGDSLKMVLISLMLIGYPINLQSAKAYLAHNFINCAQSRSEKIIYFWHFYLISIVYGQTFYDKHENSFFLKISLDQMKQMKKHQLNIMMQKEIQSQKHQNKEESQDKMKKYYRLNSRFYIDAFLNHQFFNSSKLLLWKRQFNDLNAQSLNIEQKYLNKWKFCAYQILSVIYSGNTENSVKHQQIKLIQQIDQEEKDFRVLSLSIFTNLRQLNNGTRYDDILVDVQQAAEKIINYSAISDRYCIYEGINIAFKNRNWQKFRRLVLILTQNSSGFTQFQISEMNNTMNTIKFILIFLVDQLAKQHRFSYIDFYLFTKFIDTAKDIVVYFAGQGFQKVLKTYNEWQEYQKKGKNSYDAFKDIRMRKKLRQKASFSFDVLQLTKNTQIVCGFIRNLKISFESIKKTIQQSNLNASSVFYEQENKVSFESTEKSLKQLQQTYGKQFNLSTHLQKLQKQLKKYLSYMKNNTICIEAIKKDSDIMNKYVDLQIYECRGQSMHRQIIRVVEQIFGKINSDNLLIKSNFVNSIKDPVINLNICPIPQLAYVYFVSRVIESNYNNKQYQNVLNFYYSSYQIKQFNSFWANNFNIDIVYLAMVYCGSSFEDIHEFYLFIAHIFYFNPIKQNFQNFYLKFKKLFWCKCKNCYPKPLPQGWSFEQLIEYISIKTNKLNPRQDCYMSIVYMFCLQNTKIQSKTMRKLLYFIFRSFNYLCPYAKQILNGKLHLFTLNILQKQKQKAKQKQQNRSYIRKIMRLNELILRNNQHKKSIDMLIERRFQVRNSISGLKKQLPKKIQQKYRQKLIKYHKVKQNFKISSGKINQKLDKCVGFLLQG